MRLQVEEFNPGRGHSNDRHCANSERGKKMGRKNKEVLRRCYTWCQKYLELSTMEEHTWGTAKARGTFIHKEDGIEQRKGENLIIRYQERQPNLWSYRVIQGSVLGPPTWNIMYDGALRWQLPKGAANIGFLAEKYKEGVKDLADGTIRIMDEWLTDICLELANHKTDVNLISSRKKTETCSLTVGGHEIVSQPTINYLNISTDAILKFKEHIAKVSVKTAKVYSALSRLMPNVRALTHKWRLFYPAWSLRLCYEDLNMGNWHVDENLRTKTIDRVQANFTECCFCSL